jgi:hypothetical protein
MEISEWASRYNVIVRRCEERPDHPPGDIVYRVKDLFTTRDGSWDPSDKPGTIPQWARDRYLRPWDAPDRFDDAGADHHLFARVLDLNGQPVKEPDLILYWSDGFEKLGDANYRNYVRMTPKQGSGWANQVVFNNFNPDGGERGAWCWCPRGAADVVVGGGMPNNHHVSFFAVWQAEQRQPATPGTDPGITTPAGGGVDSEALRMRAWGLAGIAFNPGSTFMIYARAHNLGAPLTPEFDQGAFRAQGFVGGIVYAPIGQWDNITHLSW